MFSLKLETSNFFDRGFSSNIWWHRRVPEFQESVIPEDWVMLKIDIEAGDGEPWRFPVIQVMTSRLETIGDDWGSPWLKDPYRIDTQS